MPARQRGSTSAGAEIRRRRLRLKRPARGQPKLDRIAQAFVVDALPAVDRPQHRQRLVGGGPTVLTGDKVEPVLDILAGDTVEGALPPVREIDPKVLAVEPDGVGRTVGIGRHVVFERPHQGRHAACLGTLAGRIFPPGNPPEHVLGSTPSLVGGDAWVASDDDTLVGCVAPTVAGAVVDDERLGAGGLDANAEAWNLVVPCEPGLLGGFERLDGTLCEREPDLGGTFSGGRIHGGDHTAERPNRQHDYQHEKRNRGALVAATSGLWQGQNLGNAL